MAYFAGRQLQIRPLRRRAPILSKLVSNFRLADLFFGFIQKQTNNRHRKMEIKTTEKHPCLACGNWIYGNACLRHAVRKSLRAKKKGTQTCFLHLLSSAHCLLSSNFCLQSSILQHSSSIFHFHPSNARMYQQNNTTKEIMSIFGRRKGPTSWSHFLFIPNPFQKKTTEQSNGEPRQAIFPCHVSLQTSCNSFC